MNIASIDPAPVFISGSGRSGTTWVLDVLAQSNRLKPVFEPLHPAVSYIGRQYAYRTITEGEDNPDLRTFFRPGEHGPLLTLWTKYRGRYDLLMPIGKNLFSSSGIGNLKSHWRFFLQGLKTIPHASSESTPIIKCTRANLMLGWVRHWVTDRIAHIVRHPAEVIHSQLMGTEEIWDPFAVLERFRADRQLDLVSNGRYRKLLSSKVNRAEAFAISWLIENQTLLDSAHDHKLAVFRYDALVHEADASWAMLCKALRLPTIPSAALLNMPSQQGRQAPRDWMFTRNDALRIQEVFDEHCFHHFSMHNIDTDRAFSAKPHARVFLP